MASMPIAARAGRVDGPESNLPHEAELPIPRAETASEGSSWLHRRASTVGGEPTGAAITEATKGPCKGSSEGLADAEDDDQPPAPTSPFPPWLEGDDDKIVQGETVGPAIKILRPASDDPTQPVDVLLHPENVGALYLMNPYSILACLALSSLVFTILAIAKGIEFATKGELPKHRQIVSRGLITSFRAGNRNASMLALAVAAYLSLYPAMLVAPATLLLAQHSGRPVLS
ncbi:hypothetical protein HKX48_005869 [Thoreauomyces humboldtii]|nr:hypothetical protein HKX48_005869 [Thoreauomyces humboldtii]